MLYMTSVMLYMIQRLAGESTYALLYIHLDTSDKERLDHSIANLLFIVCVLVRRDPARRPIITSSGTIFVLLYAYRLLTDQGDHWRSYVFTYTPMASYR